MDPKSVWHDKRVRLAVNYALNRQAVSEAACLSYCPPAGVIVPRLMDFAPPTEPFPYDPQKAKQLLAEAGYPNGFDAGELVPIPPFFEVGEAVVNDLAAGIRVHAYGMERPPFIRPGGKKAARNFRGGGWEFRQRRDPRGIVHVLQGDLCLWGLSGYR